MRATANQKTTKASNNLTPRSARIVRRIKKKHNIPVIASVERGVALLEKHLEGVA